jgi:hypothetical protein
MQWFKEMQAERTDCSQYVPTYRGQVTETAVKGMSHALNSYPPVSWIPVSRVLPAPRNDILGSFSHVHVLMPESGRHRRYSAAISVTWRFTGVLGRETSDA